MVTFGGQRYESSGRGSTTMSNVSNTRRLRSLLNAAKEQQDLTLADVVVRSEGALRKSYVGNLLNDAYRSVPLTRDQLQEVARAFGVSYEALRIAHLTDMGLIEEDPQSPAMTLDLPPGVERLTTRQRTAVLSVIRAMVDPGSPPPTTPAVSPLVQRKQDQADALLRDAPPASVEDETDQEATQSALGNRRDPGLGS